MSPIHEAMPISAPPPSFVERAKRFWCPGYANRQDDKMIKAFLKAVKGDKIDQSLLLSVETFLARWAVSSIPPKGVVELEKYSYIARQRLGMDVTNLAERIQSHDKKAIASLSAIGVDEKCFLDHPEMMNFLLSTYTYRNMLRYGHKIQFTEKGPTLLVDGVQTSFIEVMKQFSAGKDGIYSVSDTKRWYYLENGLTCYDYAVWEEAKPFQRCDNPEGKYYFQVVTSHAGKEKMGVLDKVLKGARHTWFRVIVPSGDMYSFGFRVTAKNVQKFKPLASLHVNIESPDVFEYCTDKSGHLIETKIPITKEQAKKVFDAISLIRKGSRNFNFISNNCCAETHYVMSAAGIATVDVKVSISEALHKLIYRSFVPKFIRKSLKSAMQNAAVRVLSYPFRIFFRFVSKALFHIIFTPLFLLAGASKKEKNRLPPRESIFPGYDSKTALPDPSMVEGIDTAAHALFDSAASIFDPATWNLGGFTRKMAKWQKKQPLTEICPFQNTRAEESPSVASYLPKQPTNGAHLLTSDTEKTNLRTFQSILSQLTLLRGDVLGAFRMLPANVQYAIEYQIYVCDGARSTDYEFGENVVKHSPYHPIIQEAVHTLIAAI